MKTILILVATTILFAICPKDSYSQNGKVTPDFKIVGKTKVLPLFMQEGSSVEYDPNSSDHLFISYFDKDGTILSKKQFLFTGKKLDLSVNYMQYHEKKEIFIDGFNTFYNTDGSIIKSLEYKRDSLLRQYKYYSNGQKQSMVPGVSPMNGEYRIWCQTGQLCFSGNYKNNLKEGEFQQFDPSGTLIKKGIYMNGILVAGEPVVQDIVYENPEVPAKYNNGDETIEEFLKMKSGQIDSLKNLSMIEDVVLFIFIDKTGKITKLDIQGTISPVGFNILKELLEPLPQFLPAKVENIPVDSQLTLDLLFTNKGVKLASRIIQDDKIEKMPEFPGGERELQKYLARNVRYPIEATEKGIQGKVYVSFVIEEDGSVSNIYAKLGAHPLLDAEAIKVVKQMPKWIPGYQLGKPVRVIFTMPINFSLE